MRDVDPGFPAQQMRPVDRVEAHSYERDREVVHILQSVNDLAGVMKDLSVLIIDQGPCWIASTGARWWR